MQKKSNQIENLTFYLVVVIQYFIILLQYMKGQHSIFSIIHF